MKTKRIAISITLILVLLFAAFTTGCSNKDVDTSEKDITVTVVFADKSKKEYDINTTATYLADALLEEKIIEEKAADGLYTIIAGERADYTKDKSWWCVTKSGEQVSVGMNDLTISDGDSFEITNTPA